MRMVSHRSRFWAKSEHVWWLRESAGDQGHYQSVQRFMSTLLEPTEHSLSNFLKDQWTFHGTSLKGVID